MKVLNKILSRSALLFLAAGLVFSTPSDVQGGVVARGAQSVQVGLAPGTEETQAESAGTESTGAAGTQENAGAGQESSGTAASSGTESSGNGSSAGAGASSAGPDRSFKGVEFQPDTGAPQPAGMGYSYEQAKVAAEALYSYETDETRKKICVSYVMNSIWYDPAKLMISPTGKPLLVIYEGAESDYNQAYLAAISGLEFFSYPTVCFYTSNHENLIVGIEMDERFTEAQAAENYGLLLKFLGMITEVQAATAAGDSADKAKYICDYVADRLEYDTTYKKNCLGEALKSGVTACVGYNAMTELLFGHCGVPYISVVAKERGGDTQHIFGMAKIGSAWLVFDTTNYDQDNGKEAWWLFSDQYREGAYYTDFRMVKTMS